MFSVAFQSLVDYCFLMPRVCWLLFSSSFVDLGICFNYCLDLMLERLGVALPSLEPPLPPLLLPTHRALGTLAHPLGSVSRRPPPSPGLRNACLPIDWVGGDPPLDGPTELSFQAHPLHPLLITGGNPRLGGPSVRGRRPQLGGGCGGEGEGRGVFFFREGRAYAA